mmetsp:Transcript_32125/g.52115  ORF Transcript_32125/g.52115 Transcript_32125/m.52115 type:complete len:174 (+) Transcript_32125:241-762(+)|eukprot:jgi/Bigna1/133517/aug1.21_g8225
MFIFIGGNGPLTWISLAISAIAYLAPGREGLIVKTAVAILVAGYIAFKYIPQVNQNERVRELWNWVRRGLNALGLGDGLGNGDNAAGTGGGNARPYSQRFEAAIKAIKNLPIEEYTQPSELHKKDVKTIRRKLDRRGIDHSKCLEKSELINKLKVARLMQLVLQYTYADDAMS